MERLFFIEELLRPNGICAVKGLRDREGEFSWFDTIEGDLFDARSYIILKRHPTVSQYIVYLPK